MTYVTSFLILFFLWGEHLLGKCKDVGLFEDFATWDITRHRVIVGDPPVDKTRGGYMILDWILFRI